MQDRVPAVTYESVKKLVEKELGKPMNKVFKTFDKKPISAASIGQVHKAKINKNIYNNNNNGPYPYLYLYLYI